MLVFRKIKGLGKRLDTIVTKTKLISLQTKSYWFYFQTEFSFLDILGVHITHNLLA